MVLSLRSIFQIGPTGFEIDAHAISVFWFAVCFHPFEKLKQVKPPLFVRELASISAIALFVFGFEFFESHGFKIGVPSRPSRRCRVG
jgi:hypothetical protein